MQDNRFHSSVSIAFGAYIDSGVNLEENVSIGANAVVLSFSDGTGSSHITTVKSGALIGANATVLPGIIIGENSHVRPGTVVTRSVPQLAIVEGNPAIIVGYRATLSDNTGEYNSESRNGHKSVVSSKVSGVTFHKLNYVTDLRGNLTVGEFEREVPFKPNRYFLVLDVPTAETRGEHAHHKCEQFLVCVRGSCKVIADNGLEREEFTLDSPTSGLYLPAMIWSIQYKYSSDAVLLVFASDYYDSADYIRDYNEFVSLASVVC